MRERDYWKECIAVALDGEGVTLPDEVIAALAESVAVGHENYGMAFYSPPASDRISVMEREWQAKIEAVQREYDEYRGNAESAVRRALRQHDDALVTIGDGGEVLRHDGRTEVIQP